MQGTGEGAKMGPGGQGGEKMFKKLGVATLMVLAVPGVLAGWWAICERRYNEAVTAR